MVDIEGKSLVGILIVVDEISQFAAIVVEVHIDGAEPVGMSDIDMLATTPRRDLDARHITVGSSIDRFSHNTSDTEVESTMEMIGANLGEGSRELHRNLNRLSEIVLRQGRDIQRMLMHIRHHRVALWNSITLRDNRFCTMASRQRDEEKVYEGFIVQE